jgi:hypothetical protein
MLLHKVSTKVRSENVKVKSLSRFRLNFEVILKWVLKKHALNLNGTLLFGISSNFPYIFAILHT